MESPILEVEGDQESGLSSDNESDASGSDSEEVLLEFRLLYLLLSRYSCAIKLWITETLIIILHDAVKSLGDQPLITLNNCACFYESTRELESALSQFGCM